MDLCHMKHTELAEHLQMYKRRVLLQGNSAKDDCGFQAASTEQSDKIVPEYTTENSSSPFCILNGPVSPEAHRACRTPPDVQKKSIAPREQCQRRLWIPSSLTEQSDKIVPEHTTENSSSPFCILNGPVSPEAHRACRTPPDVQKKSIAPREQCQRRLWFPSSLYRAKSFCLTDGCCCEKSGYQVQITWNGK